MDYVTWRDSLQQDSEVLELLTLMVADITPEHDTSFKLACAHFGENRKAHQRRQ